jgi:hypothetical protein
VWLLREVWDRFVWVRHVVVVSVLVVLLCLGVPWAVREAGASGKSCTGDICLYVAGPSNSTYVDYMEVYLANGWPLAPNIDICIFWKGAPSIFSWPNWCVRNGPLGPSGIVFEYMTNMPDGEYCGWIEGLSGMPCAYVYRLYGVLYWFF